MKPILYILVLFCLLSSKVVGQKTTIYKHLLVEYNTAKELYDKEKFSAAQEKFTQVLNTLTEKQSEVAVNSKYYHALCGLELFNINAGNLLIEFIYAYPESPKVKLAYFHLGRYKFRKKRYEEALTWFAKMDVYDLSSNDVAEYYFKVGYCNFKADELEKASNAFYQIKETDNSYAAPAKYYYAHIAYLQQKYQSVLQTFISLADNERFSPIVPYYITQIYYLQKKYDKVIAYAPNVLAHSIPERAGEIARLLGESYYHTSNFSAAIPYLKRFHKENRQAVSDLDCYQLGYAYYKIEKYEQAIGWLKKSINDKDSLVQSAHYKMAECYLKMNKKRYAQSSFRIASSIDANPAIKEDALFSFAKISYELSIHPYNDAILAFEKFINTYPNSKKIKDAYEFLIAVYYTTKDYQSALKSLENIKKLDLRLQEAYQKIAYYRGLELFNNRAYKLAIEHFNKSDKYIISKKIKAENSYWRAEANYRLSNFQLAIGQFKSYIFEPEAIASNNVNKAHYNIGYCYFKLKEYSNANGWFRKYIQNSKNVDDKIKNDALNRSADCFYINKQYKAAIEYYDKAAMLGLEKADYSLYQSAVTNGVIGNYKDKESLLNTLISRNQKSHLLDDAIFQLGKTQEIVNEVDKALMNFQRLIKEHPNSPYLSEALIKEGLIHYNKQDDANALIAFKRVINDYPKTPEAIEALKQVKKIHIDKGELAAYETYLSSIGGADSSAQVMDADYYEVAENSYMSGNCEQAINDLNNYLNKYPKGAYALNTHFYRAECASRNGSFEKAVSDYNYIIAQPKNKFTETALVKAGALNVKLGKPSDALDNYSRLEYLADIPANVFDAQVAQMRLNFELENYAATTKYCNLIINKDMDDVMLIAEAHLLLGKTALAQDDYNLALTEFAIATNLPNRFGAEAKYNIAKILNLRSEYDNCEVEVFSLIKKFPSYGLWVEKSLLLLADNYVAKEDLFQAKLTLQNLIENSNFPDLEKIAIEKLTQIETLEAAQKVVVKDTLVEVDLFNAQEFEKLFNEEEEIEEEVLPKTTNTAIEEKEKIEDLPEETPQDE